MVVHVEARQDCASTRTADRRRDETVREFYASLPHYSQRFRHELHGAELDVLIIGDQEENIRATMGAEKT